MKKLLALVLLFGCLDSSAQIFYRRSEFGIGFGGSNYYGDLNKEFGYDGVLYSGSLFYKYNFTPYIAMKLGTSYARINGDDKYSENYFQQNRNLSFTNDVVEGHLAFDFHFFKYRLQDYYHRITPYVTIGVGMFWHNPYAYYEGKKYYLKPMGTEGQLYNEYKDRRYKNRAFSLPIGMGLKFWVANGITMHMEVVNRFTTTDYLDDVSTTYVGLDKFTDSGPSPYPSVSSVMQDRSTEVSTNRLGISGRQRGVSTTYDQFMTMQLGFSFRLPTYKCPSSNF